MITTEGEEFLSYARQMVELQTMIEDRYISNRKSKKKFSVSMQHYSFAVEAFIELAKEFEIEDFELAVPEAKTSEVIANVRNYRSEIGVLYLNSFNEKVMRKIFPENDLEYNPLFQCHIYVYLSKGHPLAGQAQISLDELGDYPCLSFEQGDKKFVLFCRGGLQYQRLQTNH